MTTTILVIEDNQTLREGMVHVLQKMKFQVTVADSGEGGIELAKECKPDLVICDYKLPGISGLGVLESIKSMSHECEILMITAFGTIDLAVESIKKGAFDFLAKPFSMEELQLKLEKMLNQFTRNLEVKNLNEEVSYLRGEIENKYNFGEIIGNSAAMNDIYNIVKKVAATDTTVLIYGESGTGKELVARAIHLNSSRNKKPLVKVNCGSLNENLLESELFGHEKGAFTGATKQRKGRFELADNGTIFLDEIGDISANMQSKLLRVLQEKEFERVGGEETLEVDARIVTATNRDLKLYVNEQKFREDLYYRLHIVPVQMPALRERKEDIHLLVEHFLHKIGKELGKNSCYFTEEAMQRMLDYQWPGNVRELENVVERALVLTESSKIGADFLPFAKEFIKNSKNESDSLLAPGVMPLQETVEDVEKILIQRALRYAHGNKAAAARLLGLKSNTFFYKLTRYKLGSDTLK